MASLQTISGNIQASHIAINSNFSALNAELAGLNWASLGNPTADKTWSTGLYKSIWEPSGNFAIHTQYWWVGPPRSAFDATYMGDGFDYAAYGSGILNQPNVICAWRVLNQNNTPSQYVLGLSSRVYSNPSSGTIPQVCGMEGDAWVGASGTAVTQYAIGVAGHVHNVGTRPIDVAAGLFVYTPTHAGASSIITANYGLLLGDQRTAYTTFAYAIKTGNGWVDFSAADSLFLPVKASPTLSVNGELIYDSTSHTLKVRLNGVTRTITTS